MSNNENSQSNNSSNNSGGGGKRIPQNRNPNQQHHSNRIYTRYTDQRPQYRKNAPPNNNNNHVDPRTTNSKSSLEDLTRQRLLSVNSNSDQSKCCICCWHELRTYVYYSCMHYVCLNCSIKMRILCEKTDCPVCRQESKKVYCTKSQLDADANLEKLIEKSERLKEQPDAVGVYFDSEQIRQECATIMANKCELCTMNGRHEEFRTFEDLDNHMRKAHRRFFCELCLDNLKLFPFERKHYDREELAQHKRTGDKNDYSFKGHPLCEYCDQRFFDKDTLYRHFRKEHYYCHFCDSDGHEEYYKDYSQLRLHFLKHHFLCELDGCSSNAAQTHEYVVFRFELDFQAHKKQKHAKNKSDARNFGKINIEFNLNNSARDRQQQQQHKRRGGGGGGGGGASNYQNDQENDEYETNNAPQRGGGGNRNNEQQSRIQTSDANTFRMSREQYQAEEAERNRQKRVETLKEQQRKYEESIQKQFAVVVEEPKVVDSPNTPETSEPTASNTTSAAAAAATPATTATNAASSSSSSSSVHWRNIIGAGNAPKINQEADFPSLAGESKPSEFLSLRELGASIGFSSKSNNKSAWTASSSSQQPQTSTKKQPHTPPKLPTPDTNKVNNKQASSIDTTPTDTSSNAKKSAKKKNKASPNANDEIKSESKPTMVEETSRGVNNLVDPAPPPPGFESFFSKQQQQQPTQPVSGPPPPGFDAPSQTQNKPKKKTIAAAAAAEFIKPVDYETRNQDLKSQLVVLYDDKAFSQFKAISVDFKNDRLNAQDYLDKCENLLDFSQPNNSHVLKFLELIQEMIVLLPDVHKQAELYSVFEKIVQKQANLNWVPSKNRNQSNNEKLVNRLVRCNVCEQYFLRDEINYHTFVNHPEAPMSIAQETTPKKEKESASSKVEDFPALSTLSTKINPLKPVPPNSSKATGSSSSTATAKNDVHEEFPPLSNGFVNTENKFSTMPTASLFSNPSSHLSLANKKKHRLQK